MKKIIEIILGYLLLIFGIAIINYIFKFKHYWFEAVWISLLYGFIVYIRWDKKHETKFLYYMNKSRKRQDNKK